LLPDRGARCLIIHALAPECLGQNLVQENFVLIVSHLFLLTEEFRFYLLKFNIMLCTNLSNNLLYLLLAIRFQLQLLQKRKDKEFKYNGQKPKSHRIQLGKKETNCIFMDLDYLFCFSAYSIQFILQWILRHRYRHSNSGCSNRTITNYRSDRCSHRV